MDVLTFDDPGPLSDPNSFAARVRPVLSEHPVHANVIAVFLKGALAGAPMTHTRWFLIEDGGAAVATAMHTDGRSVMMSPLPEALRVPASRGLADALAPRADQVAGVNGGIADTEEFAHAWQARCGVPWSITLKEWIYAIDHAPDGPEVLGHGRISTPDDILVLVPQLASFYREAFPGQTPAGSEAEAAQRLEGRPLKVWDCDGTIVSLAGMSGPAARVGRVGPVYTPPEYRRRGFGAAVTAYAARAAFDQGAHTCMLYADQDNLTSNSVYSRLGFQRVGDNQMLAFDPA